MNQEECLYIFVDESSTLGFNKEPYFSIASVIVNEKEKNYLKNLIKRFKKNIFKDSKRELKASTMTFHEKQEALNQIMKTNFKIHYVVSSKKDIAPNLFQKKSVCFNYFIFLMLSPALFSTDKKKIFIRVDNRNIKVTSEKSLEDYLNLKLVESSVYDKNIIVNYCDSKEHINVQAVDLISNVIYAKYNLQKNHLYSLIESKVTHVEKFPRKAFPESKKAPQGSSY